MIEVSGLRKVFGQQTVLEDINMHVRNGEIFGIVGHSGAGKSTLLRCLNGLETYTAGSVKIMGQEVRELDSRGLLMLRRGMGMIFQNFNLMSRKNVFDNVAFPLKVWSVPQIPERVMYLLDLVGLASKSKERVQNLSGGQKQRVGIARALSLNPKILLCDEATSALDPKTTLSILDLLEDINRRLNLTIVLVTHQMEVVKRLCHRLLLLDGGITQATGKTEYLFLNPPDNLKKFIDEEFTVLPAGINIRLHFPREISQQSIITGMARELDINFSIVGGKLERYLDDVFGFLIINVERENLQAVLEYLRDKKIPGQILEDSMTNEKTPKGTGAQHE
jgi:D-methionine transport system ATP-binding protein